jgi:hypothetical protein
MPFNATPGITNFRVQQQRVAHGGFANLNSMSAAERRAFTGDHDWPDNTNRLRFSEWQQQGQPFPQAVQATLNNAAGLFDEADKPAAQAAIEQYLQDKGLGDIGVKIRAERGPSQWQTMPSGSRYGAPGQSQWHVLFSQEGIRGYPKRLALKTGGRTFVDDRTAPRTRVDRTMWKELQAEAADGRGLTKAEVKAIVEKHANDGRKGVLTKTERNALQRAIDEGLFATSRTAGVAEKVAKGGSLNLLDIKIANT